jgi:hypothetical protein
MIDERFIHLVTIQLWNRTLMQKIILILMMFYTLSAFMDFGLTTVVCEPIGNHIEMNPISAWFLNNYSLPLNLLIPLFVFFILLIIYIERLDNIYLFTFFVCYSGLFIFSHLMGFLPFVLGMV